MKPTLDDWVWVEAMLIQAMVGLVSTNVRQICLAYENGWKILAVLEQRCDQDIDDLEDIADETSIFIEDIKDRITAAAYTRISTSVVSSTTPLEKPSFVDCRVVFRRKEVAPRHHSSAAGSSGT